MKLKKTKHFNPLHWDWKALDIDIVGSGYFDPIIQRDLPLRESKSKINRNALLVFSPDGLYPELGNLPKPGEDKYGFDYHTGFSRLRLLLPSL
ncbi:hypothetical protein KGY58_05295, partial [Candidatus Bipolaricaulota bacterium]|nr:hypothetical protein [Candidatus Bipolaricaulota bacterium]